MTISDAKQLAEEIRQCSGDFEKAHAKEDQLRQRVLQEVLLGNPKAKQLARIALSTDGIDFPRYCA